MEISARLPWQLIADSPTVKTYTDWEIFEKELRLGMAAVEDKIPVRTCIEPSLTLSINQPRISNNIPRNASIKVLYKAPLYANIRNRMEEIHSKNVGYAAVIEISGEMSEPLNIYVPGSNGLNTHHLVIRLKERADATINIVTYSLTRGLKSFWLELILEPSSRATLRTLSLDTQPTYHTVTAALGRGARAESNISLLAGRMSRYHESYILSKNASVEVKVGAYAASNRKADIITDAVLREASASAYLSARGVVDNNGYLVHRGVARIERMAKDSSAVVDSEVRVMGEEGRGYSVPVLEVFTGLVKEARHSAAVRRLTEEEETYLMSRGLGMRDVSLLMSLEAISYSGVLEAFCVGVSDLLGIFR